MGGWLYMMADRYRGAIYTGVTADLARRAFQHREGTGSRFVRKYKLLRLVYAEPCERIEDAIAREKAIKKWRREWKIRLIEEANPGWLDLFDDVVV
jgi:putative endonuclease